MNPLIPIAICLFSVVLGTLLVYFFVFPRLPGFSLSKHKIIGGIVFVPLQGIATALGFAVALYAATITSVITALGGGLAAVPWIFCISLGGTALIFFVANYLLISLYRMLGVFEIESKRSTIFGVCSLMVCQLACCIISGVYCIAAFAPDNTFSYIDASGKTVIDKKFKYADAFKNGKAKVTLIAESENDSKYINHKGEFVPAPTEPEPVKKNKPDDDPSLYEGYSNWSLHETFDSHGFHMVPFSEGLAAAFSDDLPGRWGFIDSNYQYKIRPDKFVDARHFTEGLAPVCIDESTNNERKWGYIDKTGKMVIAPQFHNACCFSGGLAKVEIVDSKDPNKISCGFINKQGKFVIEPKYRYATSFSEGLAAVAK